MPKRPSKPTDRKPDSPESLRRDVTRLLSQQEFGSIDDVNAFLEQMVGQPIGSVEPANDQERAEDLVLAARVERSAAKRRRMVGEALALDGDCVPAHLFLAEEASGPTEALTHASNAVAAGERVLASLLTEEMPFLWGHPVGRFWLLARGLLANICWDMGDRPRALAEARELVRLNPNDNQGIRYELLQWLMRAGSIGEIDQLLAAYDERSTPWLFTTALHRYRIEGPTASATRALRSAITENTFVMPMLLGAHPMPAELPDIYSPGDENEAAIYVHAALSVWIDAGAALDWAEEVSRTPTAKRSGRTGGRSGRRS